MRVVRPGAFAIVAVVCALLGGATALVLGKATGWIETDEAATVVVSAPDGATPAAARESGDAAEPLVGNGFDPAEIYEKRIAGVVSVIALFGDGAETGDGESARGSGFVASPEGYILTSSHVITTAGEGAPGERPEPAGSVFVEFRDGDRLPARVIGWDVFDDVGLLKVDPKEYRLSPVPLGDSSGVVVGEPIAAIGSPFGEANSLSVGVVAATERSIASLTSSYDVVGAIQTDAPINRGNSGGPMFDARGRVIGIVAQIRSESGNAEGVGFAIPINAAKRSMAQLIENGRVRYAWLGVSTQTLTPRLAERVGYTAGQGAAVQSVVEGSPADEAGLRGGGDEREFAGIAFRPGGDLIVAVDGEPVATSEDLVHAISQRLLPGQKVRLTILRGDKRMLVDVVLDERPLSPPGGDR